MLKSWGCSIEWSWINHSHPSQELVLKDHCSARSKGSFAFAGSQYNRRQGSRNINQLNGRQAAHVPISKLQINSAAFSKFTISYIVNRYLYSNTVFGGPCFVNITTLGHQTSCTFIPDHYSYTLCTRGPGSNSAFTARVILWGLSRIQVLSILCRVYRPL